MRKLFVKIICTTLVFAAIMHALCIDTYGYSNYTYHGFSNDQNINLIKDMESVFLLSSNGCCIEAEQIFPAQNTYTLNTSYKVHDCTISNNCIVALCHLSDPARTEFVIYNIKSNVTKSFIVNTYINCCDLILIIDDCIYCVDQNKNSLKKYNMYGKQLQSLSVDFLIEDIFCDNSKNIYLCSVSGIYKADANSINKVSNLYVSAPCLYIDNGLFADGSGSFFTIDGLNAYKVPNFKSSSLYPSGGVYKQQLISYIDNILYAVNMTNGKAEKELKLNYNIYQMCFVKDKIFVLPDISHKNTVLHIDASELKTIPLQVDNNNNSDTDSSKTSGTSSQRDVNNIDSPTDSKQMVINSTSYTIDNDNMYITDIPPKTTIAQFKKNISYDGYSISFVNHNGKQISSGQIGTGAVVRFASDKSDYTYTLSVKGDVTGEGNVNSRDKNLMFDYLLDKISFSGAYYISADVNNSNNIDTVDLLLIMRQTENK